jgi:phosphatidylglycerol:prolipoprotein diacylglycerol transferase
MNLWPNQPSLYPWLLLAGLGVSVVFWSRLSRRDDRLVFIYVGALAGAFAGAKLAYLLAEGWRDLGQPDVWLRLATGKSILGALPGGYIGVELAKRWVGYTQPTGDWFATIAPLSIIVGRIGCWLHGCCLGRVCAPHWYTVADGSGVDRWPAASIEILFNSLVVLLFILLRRGHVWPTQHFHIYLIGYGCFRFVHEFLRDTPRLWGPLTGYQLIALAIALFGLSAFRKRAGSRCSHLTAQTRRG